MLCSFLSLKCYQAHGVFIQIEGQAGNKQIYNRFIGRQDKPAFGICQIWISAESAFPVRIGVKISAVIRPEALDISRQVAPVKSSTRHHFSSRPHIRTGDNQVFGPLS
jgi:hypothetical protein